MKVSRPVGPDRHRVTFYTILGGRWVFAGCRQPMGYATHQDATEEAELQRTNQYVGLLNTGDVHVRDNNRSARYLASLAASR